MAGRIAALILLVTALGCARARLHPALPGRHEPPASAAAGGRGLLQGPDASDCDQAVAHCESCRYQYIHGTVTKVRECLRGRVLVPVSSRGSLGAAGCGAIGLPAPLAWPWAAASRRAQPTCNPLLLKPTPTITTLAGSMHLVCDGLSG